MTNKEVLDILKSEFRCKIGDCDIDSDGNHIVFCANCSNYLRYSNEEIAEALQHAIENMEQNRPGEAVGNAIVEIIRNSERIEQFEGYEYGKLSLATRWVISPSLAVGIIEKHLTDTSEVITNDHNNTRAATRQGQSENLLQSKTGQASEHNAQQHSTI